MGATSAFQREAGIILKAAGYEFASYSGKQHAIWSKDGLPDIHVPGTPSGGRDSMLARIRRAVRKGTPLSPPAGVEKDMPKQSTEKPMSEKLVELATPYLLKKAEEKRAKRTSGETTPMPPDERWLKEISSWVERCVKTHGRILGSDFKAAGAQLELEASRVSDGRKAAGCVSYRIKGMVAHESWTDFATRVPANAMIFGGRGSKNSAPWRKAGKVVTSHQAPSAPPKTPKDPDESGGRRLDQGDLTETQRLEAEKRMRESTEKADREAAEIRARVDAGYATGNREVPVRDVEPVRGETNGNGKKQTPLEAMLELVREAALEETHALTEEDITNLRGMQEMHRRHAEEATAAAGQINLLLKRVAAREAAVAVS